MNGTQAFHPSGRRLFSRRYTAPAAPPGTYVIDETADPTRVHVMRFNAEELEEYEPTDEEAIASALRLREGRVLWCDVQGLANRALIERIAERFGLHALALADIFNTGQRPKAEEYPTHLFVVLRMCTVEDSGDARWEQVAVVLGRGYVLTFQERRGDCLDPLRARIRQGRPVIRSSGPDYLATMVLDAIVDGYFPVLDVFAGRLEDLETRVVEDPSRGVIGSVYAIRRQLLTFRRAVWPLRDVVGALLRDRHELFTDHALLYLRDVADHVMQVVDVLESYRELAGTLVDTYLSSVGNRTNEVMRVLTVIASIFVPLTFLAGIYGMNFVSDEAHPLNLPELRWRYGYVAFWAVCVALAVVLLVIFARLGWIGSGGRRDREE